MVKWLEDACFYEIYPQSFQDTNADGIGDLQGIIDRLDYIRGIGCNAVWINPCFVSPFGDAGYDVSDYLNIAPRYGTNEDMKHLFMEAHKRDMHVLLDLVPGHTSVEHPWFRQSCLGTKNAYTDRYVWTDSVWKQPEGMSVIRGISERDGSCMVNFFSHQPALNYGFYQPDPQESWQQSMEEEGPRQTLEAMENVMRFWLQLGCDGFRVDMAGSLVKNDPEGKGTIALWQKVRSFLNEEFPDAAMISEWGEPDKSLAGGFHMDFLLHFGPSHYNDLFRCEEPFFSSRGKGDISAFVSRYMENYEKTNQKGLICIPSGNHDMDRLARRLRGDELKAAFAFLLSMPGAPFLYYGDEIGMRYVENLQSVEGGYYRTGSRSPMQWDGSLNHGFSSCPPKKLYVAMDPAADAPTVQQQEAQPDSLLHEIQKLIAIRREHPALHNQSSVSFLYAEKNQYPLAYLRSCAEEKILVVINPSGTEQHFTCPVQPLQACYQLNGTASYENGILTIPAGSAVFYTV